MYNLNVSYGGGCFKIAEKESSAYNCSYFNGVEICFNEKINQTSACMDEICICD